MARVQQPTDPRTYTFNEFILEFPDVYPIGTYEGVEDDLHRLDVPEEKECCWYNDVIDFICEAEVAVNFITWQREPVATGATNFAIPVGRAGFALHDTDTFLLDGSKLTLENWEQPRGKTLTMREYINRFMRITFTVWSPPVPERNIFLDAVKNLLQ